MEKLLVFLVLFLFYLGNTEAAEKKYLNIGVDPADSLLCDKKAVKRFYLDEDKYAATTARSHKVSVGWLHKGEEIGVLADGEEIICRCGNSVKFLQSPSESQEEVVIETTYYEPYYTREKTSYFWHYEPSYGGRYYGGGHYYSGGYRHHYPRHYHPRHHRHR